MATNAESALALFEHSEEPIGLVVSEQRLSRMSGSRLADELRRRDPTIPILLVGSGFDRQPGADPELDKPFTLEALERRIAQVARGSFRGSPSFSGRRRSLCRLSRRPLLRPRTSASTSGIHEGRAERCARWRELDPRQPARAVPPSPKPPDASPSALLKDPG